jgi:hypothetical protein
MSITVHATQWIHFQIKLYNLHSKTRSLKDQKLELPLPEFHQNLIIFTSATHHGLAFGYQTIQWDTPYTSSAIYIEHQSIPWSILEQRSFKHITEHITAIFLETMFYRQSQFKQCQFCFEFIIPESLFDHTTCQNCASRHFGVVY